MDEKPLRTGYQRLSIGQGHVEVGISVELCKRPVALLVYAQWIDFYVFRIYTN